MAVKTSLQVKTFNPVTNKNVTKTATYSNPNATDAQLNSFAQNFYGGLSDNTVNSVIRVDKLNITNAESAPTVIYTLPDEAYNTTNPLFLAAIYGNTKKNYWAENFGTDAVVLKSITPLETDTSVRVVFETGGVEHTIDGSCFLKYLVPTIVMPVQNTAVESATATLSFTAPNLTSEEMVMACNWVANNQTAEFIKYSINKSIANRIEEFGTVMFASLNAVGNKLIFTADTKYSDRYSQNFFRIRIQDASWIYNWGGNKDILPQYTADAVFDDFTYNNKIFTARFD